MGSVLIGSSSARHLRPELMDQPELDAEAHIRALRGLGRINRVSRSEAILWPSLIGLAAENRGEPIHVLDLACGGGDVVMALARRCGRRGLEIRLDGCDISPVAVAYASRNAEAAGAPVRFFQRDVLDQPIPDGYHVVMCSLFLHHLGEDQAVLLLKKMAGAAGQLVLVSDLIPKSRRLSAGSSRVLVAEPFSDRAPRWTGLCRRGLPAGRGGGSGPEGGPERRAADASLAATVLAVLESSMLVTGPATTWNDLREGPWDAIVIGAGPAGALAGASWPPPEPVCCWSRSGCFLARRFAARASTVEPWGSWATWAWVRSRPGRGEWRSGSFGCSSAAAAHGSPYRSGWPCRAIDSMPSSSKPRSDRGPDSCRRRVPRSGRAAKGSARCT